MMKQRTNHGFTLVEILTVIVIILIIAGWIIAAFGPGNVRAAKVRALAEITQMSAACESFKTDYGDYPRSEVDTEPAALGGEAPISPVKHGNPTSDAYKKGSAFLYSALSGDEDKNGKLEPPDEKSKGYIHFEPKMLNFQKDGNGNILKVNFIQDPFANSYGYSTAGAKAEADFKAQVATKGVKAERSSAGDGFNPTFDLWSTGGKVITTSPVKDEERNQWVKNW